MKAMFNGCLHLSVLDGWWAEGYNGKNGWGIEGDPNPDLSLADRPTRTRSTRWSRTR